MATPERTYPLSTERLLGHLKRLASDEMQGRESETTGNARARRYIRTELTNIGLEPVFPGFEQPFVFDGLNGERTQGINLVGMIRGTRDPETYIILSAHYDHLGRSRSTGQTYSGADDNASGVACVLELARAFAEAQPLCTIVCCLFDGEEAELKGSRAFVERAPISLQRVALVINVDMIGRADEGLLWVAGTSKSPWLEPHLQAIAAAVDVPLVLGHDKFTLKRGENWTYESDHGSFHDAGVPWLYFGVTNHKDTHETSDEVENIDEEFFIASAEAVRMAARHFDEIGRFWTIDDGR